MIVSRATQMECHQPSVSHALGGGPDAAECGAVVDSFEERNDFISD